VHALWAELHGHALLLQQLERLFVLCSLVRGGRLHVQQRVPLRMHRDSRRVQHLCDVDDMLEPGLHLVDGNVHRHRHALRHPGGFDELHGPVRLHVVHGSLHGNPDAMQPIDRFNELRQRERLLLVEHHGVELRGHRHPVRPALDDHVQQPTRLHRDVTTRTQRRAPSSATRHSP